MLNNQQQQQPFVNPQLQQQPQQFPQQHPQQQQQQQLPQQRQQFSFSDANQQPNHAFAFPQQAPSTPTTTPQPPPALQSFPRQSFSVSSSSTSSEDALRQGKIVGSIQPPSQVIQKSPASEIESSKQAEAKDKAAKGKDKDKDEYVVYYYYYYDDDNKKNLSLNFDDVPNLEGFDKTDSSKLKGKGSSQRLSSANPQNRFEPKTVTTSPPSGQQPAPPPAFPLEQGVTSAPQTVTQVSVSVSVSEGTNILLPSQPFEAKRPPVAGPPDLEFTGAKLAPDTGAALAFTPDGRGLVTPQAVPVSTVAPSADTQVANEISGKKGAELLTTSAETTTPTTTTTTTEATTTLAPTTTTEETTTTEKSKRPFGNRRRFGGAHGAGSHVRTPGSHVRGKSHTTSTTTTPATSSTRRLLGGLRRNRPTPRPSASSRLQFGRRPSPVHSRHHKEEEPEEEESTSHAEAESPTTTTAATPANGAKKRFGGGSRFGGKSSGRTRTSSTAAASSTAAPKRPGGRPNSGALFSRTNRGPRPRVPFNRHRPGAKKVEDEEKPEENEEAAPATTPESKDKEEASAASTETASKHEEAASSASESEATSEDSHPTEAPAVTPDSKPAHGRSRFGSRPRPAIFGGRPRPNLGR